MFPLSFQDNWWKSKECQKTKLTKWQSWRHCFFTLSYKMLLRFMKRKFNLQIFRTWTHLDFFNSIFIETKDVFGSSFLIYMYFFIQFPIHSIFTPLAMDQFARTRSQATLWVGIIFFIAGCIAVFTFAIADVLEKR